MSGRKNAFYSLEFKQEAARRYLEGGISYRELSKELGIKSKKQLQKWRGAIEHIKSIHSVRPFYGYRRVAADLRREGFAVNHKRVYRIMCEAGIQSVIRKKRRYFGRSGSVIFPNLLVRDFQNAGPARNLPQISPICPR